MNKFIHYLLRISPYPELIIRRIYYSNEFIHRLIKKNSMKKAKINKPIEVKPELYHKVCELINQLGIENGDILLVHSSMDELAVTGASPKQIIDLLLEIVGEEGTIAVPAFPIYKRADSNGDNNEINIYDPKKSLCWTGMLPNIFLRYPGVIRSEFPVNPLAAKGLHADEMMRNNLESDLAHGKNSAWGYCVEHHAKILFLGTDVPRSGTIIHAYEDLLDEEWPVKDWYEDKQYIIRKQTGEQNIKVRSRKPFWARFFLSYYYTNIMVKNNLIEQYYVDGIRIEYISDSKKFVDFLITKAKQGELYYKIPKRYRRR